MNQLLCGLRVSHISGHTAVITVTVLASILNIVTLAQDAHDWRSSRLCEANRACDASLSILPAMREMCNDLDDHLSHLFRIYSVSIPCTITKIVFLLTSLSAHKTANLPLLQSFSLTSAYRSRTSFFIWATAICLDFPALCASSLRFVIWNSKYAAFEETLYPAAEASYPTVLAILALLSSILPFASDAWMIHRARRLWT